MDDFLSTIQRRNLQESSQDVFKKSRDEQDDLTLENLDENWQSNPLIIMMITGIACLGLCCLITCGYCCYKCWVWRKQMKVGEEGFIQDDDLHLAHTRSMQPYNPNIINLEKFA